MRINALTGRIIHQFLRDKRTLALMFLAPLLVMSLVSLIFNGKTYHPKIGVVHAPSTVIQTLEQSQAKITSLSEANANKKLKDQQLDAVLNFNNRNLNLTLEGSDPKTNQAVLQVINHLSTQNRSVGQKPTIHYLHGGPDLTSFDNFGPVLLGIFVFFFVFLIAGVSFLRERTNGTLERLMASPLRRSELVIGYILGFGLFTILQSALIVWYSVYVLNLWMVGSFWFVLLVTLILALVALSLGTLLSTFANNELQMIQFIPLVIVPQVFFSGLFNLDTISDWISWISVITPLYYAADALRDIMIRGEGWQGIYLDLGVLCLFAILFVVLNSLALRKYRRI
ncbi:ABC transporter permease [Camelliibacillus cellulosilyticus]|uniref:ABC transporter permease n=1 Tax=Camelliibacillus cellulosilyticus TaxID=2174486 RepID=A0ABV9GKL6_9BACL